MRIRLLLLAALVTACGARHVAPSVPPPAIPAVSRALDDPQPALRLPGDVTPSHYALALTIDPATDRFSGEVSIDVALAQPRAVIWLHARDMHLTEVTITPAGGAPITATPSPSRDEGFTALRGEHPFPVGRATIHLRYHAPFDRTLKGLYRVDVGHDHYAYTQFEATDARYAFPCFDEPGFKTPFDVTLTVPTAATAISNTRATSDQPAENGFHTVHFAPTLPLPTYLIAFAVGPFDVVDGPAIPPHGERTTAIPLRGVTTHGRGNEVRYALEHTPEIVAQLEDYFGIPYPYDKLDLLAVPDFAAGAMENAGAITFRDGLILVDPQHAPEEQLRGFFGVTAHELAHQWFGDLVTMQWWDDIWLNEAFATWMAEHVVERLHPEWHSEIGFLNGVEGAMGQDAYVSARRIRQPIETPHDINNAFDGITYQKGGGVLSMFEHFVGTEVFQRGIQSYLRAHRFGNATSDDLMAALSTASGRDIGTPLRSFLEQPGGPLLHTTLECPAGGRPTLHVTQARFFPVGSTGDRTARWQIPLCLRYAGDAGAVREQCQVLSEADARITLEGTSQCPAWLLPNDGGYGYYRFTLAGDDLAHLGHDGYAHLSPREKLAYADAIISSFAAGTLPATDALPALAPLAREPYRSLANAPMGIVRFARERVADDALRPRVESWARALYAPVAQGLGWEPAHGVTEDGDRRLLRASVLDFMARIANDPAVRREAARRGRAWLGPAGGALDPSAVAPEVASLAVYTAVQDGDAAVFDLALERLRTTNDAILRNRLLDALGGVRNSALATRALDLALDPALRVNEVLRPLSAQMDEMVRRDDAWTWLEGHIGPISDRVSATRVAGLPWLGAHFCDEAHAQRVEAFFRPRIENLPGGPRNLAGATEAIRLCTAKVSAQGDSVRAFFAHPHPGATAHPGTTHTP